MAGTRLALVIDSLWVGGTERSTAELMTRLPDHGFDPTLVCLQRRDLGVEREVLDTGADVFFLESRRLLAQRRELRAIFRKVRPRIIHSALFRSNLLCRLARPATQTVLLNSIVNDSYGPLRRLDPSLDRLKLRLVREIDAFTATRVNHFHAVSHATKEAAMRDLRIPSDRITVVERGRDPARLGTPSQERRFHVRSRLGIVEGSPVILTVGRQDYQKGQDLLLLATKALRARHPGLVLLIVGREGSASERLEVLRAQGATGDRVRLLGHRDDVPDLLAAADVFVLPSRFEGFPGAALEAMAMRLPIVAWDIPPIREILDHEVNGLLAPCFSVEGMALAIGSLLSEPGRARTLGLAAETKFRSRFHLDRSVERMIELYRGLLTSTAG